MKKFIIGKRNETNYLKISDEIYDLEIIDFIELFYKRFNCAKGKPIRESSFSLT